MIAEDGLSRNPPLVVELFGQPGAGKSTVARAAAENLHAQTRANLGALWKQRHILANLLLVGRALFDASCLAQAAALARKARLWRADSLSRLLRLVIKSHWLRRQSGILLLEEGHLQDLWSIFYSAGRVDVDPHLISPLIACLYRGLDARVVFLDVSADELVDRIQGRSRGRSRLDRLAEEELRSQLAVSAQLPRHIVEAARMAGLNVQRLDAAPIESTVKLLRDLIPSFH